MSRGSWIGKFLALLVLSASFVIGSCARAPQAVEYQPYESLLQVLSDFALHRNDDLYRSGYPRDITGANLFKAVLQRLNNYETLNQGRYPDIVAVTRGQLHERLGDYEAAIAAYSDLGATPSEEMRAVAQQSFARVQELSAAARRPMDTANLSRFIADLEMKRDDLLRLAQRFEGTPYRSLALIEAEQADVERVLLMFNCRYLMQDGLTRSLQEAQALMKRHEASHRALKHRLMLGDFYYESARDYVALNRPDRASFDPADFSPLVAAAREHYFQVSRQDGAPEKLEARGKLQALEAFNQQVESLRPASL